MKESVHAPLVYPKPYPVKDIEEESDTEVGVDGSEKQYSQARPPTWDKSERADKNLPTPLDKEWEEDVTPLHPAKADDEDQGEA